MYVAPLSLTASLAESSVSSTLDLVAATFRENGRDDPKSDAEGNVSQLLQWQLRLYKKDNPKERQQKALHFAFFDSFSLQKPQNSDKQ